MSAAARWSYTAKATWWPLQARHPGSRAPIYGEPRLIDCDFASDGSTMTEAGGDQFVTNEVIYTEQPGIKRGDMILIGVSTLADPVAAGASEVRAIGRSADTFDRLADDYKIGTL